MLTTSVYQLVQSTGLGRWTDLVHSFPLHPAPKSPDLVQMSNMNQKSSSPGGRLMAPLNAKAIATGPKKILASWDPPPGNPAGYKVRADGGGARKISSQNNPNKRPTLSVPALPLSVFLHLEQCHTPVIDVTGAT